MASITCCLSTWVTVAALPRAFFPWGSGRFFWVCEKQISAQSNYTALKTLGPGQRLEILFQAQGN